MSRSAPSCQCRRARRELLAHAVPDLLGVDEHAVHVEDDRAVTARIPAVDVDEAAPAGAWLEHLDGGDIDHVVAGWMPVERSGADPAHRAFEQAGLVG